jgi:membrane protein implicated in regulation of membrane protease activity
MFDFLKDLPAFQQAYWIIAIVGSIIFIVIFIMTILGGDADTDLDADIDADADFDVDDGGIGFQFFSFKNIMAFFTIFGWSGLSCIDNGLSKTTTLIVSSIAGLLMMLLVSLMFYWLYKMVQSGTLKMKNAIGAIGEVYLTIGANRSKMGKVQIKVQGALRELEALTDADEDLKTGTVIKVVDIISAELLLVEKSSK